MSGRHHIPERDPVRKECLQSGCVGKRTQLDCNDTTDELPELVARVGIVLAAAQRLHAWKRAKDQRACVAAKNGVKTPQRLTGWLSRSA